jgi:DNA-binding NarL/FixJ family response regulator
MGYGREREHLNSPSETDRDSLIEKVKVMIQDGNSQRYIASKLGIAVGTVNKYSKL